MPVIDLNEVKKESKFHEWIRKGRDWCEVHKDELGIGAVVASILIPAAAKWHSDRAKVQKAEQEQFNKERYVYDHSLGMYLKLKRPLTNNDYVLINARKAHGEKLSNILAGLGLLE